MMMISYANYSHKIRRIYTDLYPVMGGRSHRSTPIVCLFELDRHKRETDLMFIQHIITTVELQP